MWTGIKKRRVVKIKFQDGEMWTGKKTRRVVKIKFQDGEMWKLLNGDKME